MATYYVDPAAPFPGLNDGSSWENAFTNLQTAINTCVGEGNTIYARGTQTLVSNGIAGIDFTAAASGISTSFNRLIGCNASGIADGTRFILSGNGKTNGKINGIKCATSAYWRLEHIEVRECGATGFSGNSPNWIFINCKSYGNTGHGFDGLMGTSDKSLILCISESNISTGFKGFRNGYYYFCVSKNNGAGGFFDYANLHYGCIAVNNNGEGFYNHAIRVIHCIAHGNTTNGFYNSYSNVQLIGCRATENAEVGFGTSGSHITVLLACYAAGNTQSDFGIEDTLKDLMFNEVGTLSGYVDAANGDFNLTADATMRRTAVTLPS